MTLTHSEPAPTSMPHEELSIFEKHLQDQLRGRIHKLRVIKTSEGVVLLGYAATYYAKQLAQHNVLKAFPLPLVANKIEVLEPMEEVN